MKIAFPTQIDTGLDSQVFSHFGSARYFIVVDSDSQKFESFENPDAEHAHGQCQPLKALNGQAVDAVVVGGIGGGALNRLNAAGIKIFRAVEGSIHENLQLILSEKLPEFTLLQTCSGHGPGGQCAH